MQKTSKFELKDSTFLTNISGFTIPVIVRVTDVNDNTPSFLDAPYLLNISELTIVGSRIFRNIKAIDADQVRQLLTKTKQNIISF